MHCKNMILPLTHGQCKIDCNNNPGVDSWLIHRLTLSRSKTKTHCVIGGDDDNGDGSGGGGCRGNCGGVLVIIVMMVMMTMAMATVMMVTMMYHVEIIKVLLRYYCWQTGILCVSFRFKRNARKTVLYWAKCWSLPAQKVYDNYITQHGTNEWCHPIGYWTAWCLVPVMLGTLIRVIRPYVRRLYIGLHEPMNTKSTVLWWIRSIDRLLIKTLF